MTRKEGGRAPVRGQEDAQEGHPQDHQEAGQGDAQEDDQEGREEARQEDHQEGQEGGEARPPGSRPRSGAPRPTNGPRASRGGSGLSARGASGARHRALRAGAEGVRLWPAPSQRIHAGCGRSRRLSPGPWSYSPGPAPGPRSSPTGGSRCTAATRCGSRSAGRTSPAPTTWTCTASSTCSSWKPTWSSPRTGFGPFERVTGFARVEGRFDCVYLRGCGLFGNADAFGSRPRRLPQRLQNGRRTGLAGHQRTIDVRPYAFRNAALLGTPGSARHADAPRGPHDAVPVVFNSIFAGAFTASPGPDGIPGSGDDAGTSVFQKLFGCMGGTARTKMDNAAGYGNRDLFFLATCGGIEERGFLRDVPNPFHPRDANPWVGLPAGPRLTLPFRPAPRRAVGEAAARTDSQGLFIPSAALRERMRRGRLDNPMQFFTTNELQWNRGASQQSEKELRELYLELEMFDAQLWLRVGKQMVVWGKTELFRNQDQFNPQDVGIPPLSTLEESRIGIWAIRGVWSFYEVGPLEDVRLEGRARGRRLRAHRHRHLRRALGLARGLSGGAGPGGPWCDRRRYRGRRAAARSLERRARPRVRAATGVALGPLQLRAHRLLWLHRRAGGGDAVLLRARRRPVDRPAPACRPGRALPHRHRARVPDARERGTFPQRQPAALPLHLRLERGCAARHGPRRLWRELPEQPRAAEPGLSAHPGRDLRSRGLRPDRQPHPAQRPLPAGECRRLHAAHLPRPGALPRHGPPRQHLHSERRRVHRRPGGRSFAARRAEHRRRRRGRREPLRGSSPANSRRCSAVAPSTEATATGTAST